MSRNTTIACQRTPKAFGKANNDHGIKMSCVLSLDQKHAQRLRSRQLALFPHGRQNLSLDYSSETGFFGFCLYTRQRKLF
jgi:hypothetical protein